MRTTVTRIPETKEERRKLFNVYDPDGNNLMTLKNLWAITEQEKVFAEFDNKPAIMRAYKAADKIGSEKYEGLITRKEFVYFIKYIQVYNDLWKFFDKVDENDDRRIDAGEFQKAANEALKMNLNDDELKAEFARIDTNNGGHVLFDEFCEWGLDKLSDQLDDE
eukprot:CAMPEP_0114987378 /NCGR_PEP_ID=MMETSP0216-20121206/8976_1 /TAXON_ID=223996 /ORGANISM="Protocruzia adherens, Strain Boccale" /LENGTH=163 /DNA_ID=CAMNT_0002349973 /DNA_START=54 /DNA_END=545 /DNA_ORIENTATION=+